jgi:hypothetical protein
MEFRVNPIGLNCMTIASFARGDPARAGYRLNFCGRKPTNKDTNKDNGADRARGNSP